MLSISDRWLGDGRLIRRFDRSGFREAIADEPLQPLHLTDLGAREKVNVLRIQIDCVPPLQATGDSGILGDFAYAELGCGLRINATVGPEGQLFRGLKIDTDPV